jgi:predicted esterase
MVMDKVFPKANEVETCAFDIVLGHSQGAILMAALLSLHEKLWDASGPSGYILNGCAWPNPYSNSLLSITDRRQRSGTFDSLPRIIFVMGAEDSINPIDSALQVHDAYFAADFDVSIVNHGGGHSVPVGRDEDSERALEEVVDWIVEIAKQKALQLTNYI